MIVWMKKYVCDKCGKSIEEYSRIFLKGDLYWGEEASVHLCKDCTRSFQQWLKEERDDRKV